LRAGDKITFWGQIPVYAANGDRLWSHATVTRVTANDFALDTLEVRKPHLGQPHPMQLDQQFCDVSDHIQIPFAFSITNPPERRSPMILHDECNFVPGEISTLAPDIVRQTAKHYDNVNRKIQRYAKGLPVKFHKPINLT
jgi:hypothetical protein